MAAQPTVGGWQALRDTQMVESEVEAMMTTTTTASPSAREQANEEEKAWAASEAAYHDSIRRSNALSWQDFYDRIAAYHRHAARNAERKADEAARLAENIGGAR